MISISFKLFLISKNSPNVSLLASFNRSILSANYPRSAEDRGLKPNLLVTLIINVEGRSPPSDRSFLCVTEDWASGAPS